MGTIDIFPDMLDPMQTEYSQIVTRFDPAYGASWVLMNPKSVPCFTPELLTELQCYNRSIEYSGGKIWSGGKFHLASVPGKGVRIEVRVPKAGNKGPREQGNKKAGIGEQ